MDTEGIQTIRCERVRPGASLPVRMTAGSAGWDLTACVERPLAIEPGSRCLVPTGLALAIPPGMEGAIRPRSGLALRSGVGVLNSPGTIDSDYRGEVQILLVNLGTEPYVVEHGARIAQIVFQRLPAVGIEWGRIDETARGAGGFGHTGSGRDDGPQGREAGA
ncbi:MAG: dUTP diphosphatase [Candidatus Eisenbacteria bacterium]|uniref:Deoxyuridine 5'-triphosphate nucleotidohydrolase n=1 Tax=Eiseniibacteriota bacterium TaxID=2212470 RepID=A0A956RPI0_UNCEI|nr:dUTP diphosphatase [Candidatus Eisenbacteria bacterium]